MIGGVIALIGCVLSFVALGMSPNTFTRPLSNLVQLRELPKPKAAVTGVAFACLMIGALVSAVMPI